MDLKEKTPQSLQDSNSVLSKGSHPSSGNRSSTPKPPCRSETKNGSKVWRTPDKLKKTKLESNRSQRQSNRDDKEFRLRSIGAYDKYLKPQSLTLQKIYNIQIQNLFVGKSDKDVSEYLHKLVEDIMYLVRGLTTSRSRDDCFIAISTFAKFRTTKALFSCENFEKLTDILQDVFEEIMGLMPQSGEPFAPLRSILENFEAVRSLPIFAKLHKFLMYIVCTSILEKVGIKFSKAIFEQLHITASVKKQYTMGLSFLHCVLDTVLYVCETGYQCFKLGSIQPLFHSGGAYSDWIDEAYDLKRLSNFTSNLEAHGIKKCDYLYRLKVAIEKGQSILNQVKVQSPIDSKMVRSLLAEITYIRDSELTRKIASATRPAPFAVLLYGGSGIGKSLFCELILHYYQQIFGLPAGDEFIFTRNAADPFWNNFGTHCWGLVLDDVAFLDPKVVQGGDPTMLEMLQIINNVPYTPPQADLCDKGKTPLVCKVVVATTNTQHLNTVGQFSCPLAVQRRMPYVIDLQPKINYARDGVFLNPEATPLPIAGELPNIWDIVVKRVLPANDDRNHQMAKFEVVETFHEIKEFLTWFGGVAKQHEVNQKKAGLTASVFKDIKFCERCYLTESDCVCLTVQSDEEQVWYRPEVMKQYLSPRVELSSFDYYYQLFCIYLKCCVDTQWLRVMMIFFMVLSSVAEWWSCFSALVVMTSVCYFVDSRITYIDCFRWGLNHPIVRETVREKACFLGEKIKSKLSHPILPKIVVACGVVATGGMLFQLYRRLTKPSLKEQSVDDFGAHTLEKTGDSFNPWYNDNFELSRFDLSPKSLSYRALSMEQLDTIVSRNAVCFVLRSVTNGITKKTTNRAYCVGDHVYLTNAHAIPSGTFTLDVFSQSANGVSANLLGIKVTPGMVYIEKSRDIGFIYLRCRPPMRNMRNLFCTEPLKGKYKGYYISRNTDGAIERKTVANIEYRESLRNDTLNSETPSWMGYVKVPTQIGDCGSILLASSPIGPIILGIHYLGGADVVAATKVDVGMIQRAYDAFNACVIEPSNPTISSETSSNVLGPLHKKSVFRYLDDGLASVYGTFEGFRPARKTEVKDTVLRPQMEQNGYKTEYGPPDFKGYGPWRAAALQMINPAVRADSDILAICVNSYIKDILDNLPKGELERIKIIDLHLATNGAPGVKYVDGIKRSTSAGFPWNKSKKFFLNFIEGTDEVEFNGEIKSRVCVILEKYSRGELYAPIFTGSLKDEPTKQKVRLFCGAPIDWSLVVRMYMLTLVQVVQRNPLVFEAAPGTVVQSMTWHKFWCFLTCFSASKMICGDYGAFDKRMGAWIILAAFDVYIAICKAAGWPEVDLRALRCIGEDVAFAWVNFDGDLVQFMNVNPSGWPLTVIINCTSNSLYMRYCYYVLNPEHEVRSFVSNVHLLTYGDDNIMGVSPRAEWFNHTAISVTLADIDVKYTMADKKAESVPYVSISESSFLKRTWRFDEDMGCYLAPLAEESIIKSLMVCVASKSISAEHQAMEIISAAHREYFNYGKVKFLEMEKFLRDLVVGAELGQYVVKSSFPSWEHLRDEFFKASEQVELEVQSEDEEELVNLFDALPACLQSEIMDLTPCACVRCEKVDCPFRFSTEHDVYLICMQCERCFDAGSPCHEQYYCDLCYIGMPAGGVYTCGENVCIECAMDMLEPQSLDEYEVSATRALWESRCSPHCGNIELFFGHPYLAFFFVFCVVFVYYLCIGLLIGGFVACTVNARRANRIDEFMKDWKVILVLLVMTLCRMFIK